MEKVEFIDEYLFIVLSCVDDTEDTRERTTQTHNTEKWW